MMAAGTLSNRRKNIVLAGTMLGLLVSAVSQTVVSTALPRIIGELGGLSYFTWVFTASMLTSTTTVPLVGKLGDMYGRKPFFMAGIVIFMAASALAGLSQNMTQLIIFRGMQGIGGGALMASAFAIIGDLFPPSERGRYMGLFTAVFGLASIMGPTVGGTITDNLSWRWVFYVNVPFGVVALTVLWFGFPWIRPTGRKPQIDYLGVATLTAAIVPLLLALVWAGDLYAWRSPQIFALFALAALSTIAFVYTESRAPEPIIPIELFRNRVFAVASLVTFLMGMGMFGSITFMPLFVQGVLGASATNSGFVTTPMMIGLVVSSTLVGLLVSRIGKYRLLVVAGGIVLAVGMYLLTGMSETTSHATAIRNMVVIGVGLGIGMPLLGLAVQNAVPYRLLGVVSSSSQFFRQIGGTLGVAIFGTLVTTHLRENLQQNLPAEVIASAPPPLLEQVENPQVLLSPTALEQLEASFAALGDAGPVLFSQTIEAMRITLSDGLGLVYSVAFGVSLVALVASVMLPEVPLRTTIESADELVDGGAPRPTAPAAGGQPVIVPVTMPMSVLGAALRAGERHRRSALLQQETALPPDAKREGPSPPDADTSGWEYRAVYVDVRGSVSTKGLESLRQSEDQQTELVRQYLETAGEDGWRVAGILPLAYPGTSYFTLKRPQADKAGVGSAENGQPLAGSTPTLTPESGPFVRTDPLIETRR